MTPADLQRIRASASWRSCRIEVFHDTSQGSVLVKGQRAPRGAWRYRLLDGFARLAGASVLRAVPAHGGARAQQIEVARLHGLAAAGVPVPRLLHVEEEFFVQSWLGERRLDRLLRKRDAALWWRRGLHSLVSLHAHGQYLSQAFARNFVAHGEALATIDFEDDPLEVMPLEQAQARDWLAYLHSSANVLRLQPAQRREALIDTLRAELARERTPVRWIVTDTAQRLCWLQRLPALDGRGWRRHAAIAQSAVALMLSAHEPSIPTAEDPKVTHARHH